MRAGGAQEGRPAAEQAAGAVNTERLQRGTWACLLLRVLSLIALHAPRSVQGTEHVTGLCCSACSSRVNQGRAKTAYWWHGRIICPLLPQQLQF